MDDIRGAAARDTTANFYCIAQRAVGCTATQHPTASPIIIDTENIARAGTNAATQRINAMDDIGGAIAKHAARGSNVKIGPTMTIANNPTI